MKTNLKIDRIPYGTDAWYEYRKNGIGGSELATVLGMDKYNTVARVFYEKIGSVDMRRDDNSKMFFGRYMEDKIADLWQYYDGTPEGWIDNYKSGKIVRRCRNVNGYVVNPDYPWLFASLDRVMNIDGGVNLITGQPLTTEGVLEVKTLTYWASQIWQDGIPISYLIQVHVYMIIIESDYAEIAILKDGNDFYVEKIQRDDALCSRIINISKAFWHNCVLPARDAYKKKKEAEKAMNFKEVEKWDAEVQKHEPEPDNTEAYTAFMNERFLKERDVMEGNMEMYDLCKQDKILLGINGIIDTERNGIKNKLIKELTLESAESISFGTLGSVDWSERKGSKNRTFSNRIREKPPEDILLREFKKINLNCY